MKPTKSADGWETLDTSGPTDEAVETTSTTENHSDNEDTYEDPEVDFSADSVKDVVVTEDTDEDAFEEPPAPKAAQSVKEATQEVTPKQRRNQERYEKLIGLVKNKDAEKARLEADYQQKLSEAQARIAEYEEAMANTYYDSSEQRIKAAEGKLKRAKQDVDIDLELEATRELQEAIVQKNQAELYKKQIPEKREAPVGMTVNQRVSDAKTRAWLQANEKLAQSPLIASEIRRIAQTIQKEGFEPHEDNYYEEVTKRLNSSLSDNKVALRARPAYSEYFDGEDDDATELKQPEAPVKKTQPTAPTKANPLSASPRMASNGKKTTLVSRATQEDAAFARRMGLTTEDFMKNSILEEKKNKFGYSPVFIPQKKKK